MYFGCLHIFFALLESKAGIEGLALNVLIFDLFEPHDFTGKDMKVHIGKKRLVLRIALFIWRPGKGIKVHLIISLVITCLTPLKAGTTCR